MPCQGHSPGESSQCPPGKASPRHKLPRKVSPPGARLGEHGEGRTRNPSCSSGALRCCRAASLDERFTLCPAIPRHRSAPAGCSLPQPQPRRRLYSSSSQPRAALSSRWQQDITSTQTLPKMRRVREGAQGQPALDCNDSNRVPSQAAPIARKCPLHEPNRNAPIPLVSGNAKYRVPVSAAPLAAHLLLPISTPARRSEKRLGSPSALNAGPGLF